MGGEDVPDHKLVFEYRVADLVASDLLSKVRLSLDEVVRRGGTFEGWKANILPDLKKAGWWGVVNNVDLTGTIETIVVDEIRLRHLFSTNIEMGISTIRWCAIQNQKDVLSYLRMMSYRAWEEDGHCFCGLIDGVILPVDHPYWLKAFPPNGPDCKCILQQVSERRMKKKGWLVTADLDLPSVAAIPEDYRRNFGVEFPTSWQPDFT